MQSEMKDKEEENNALQREMSAARQKQEEATQALVAATTTPSHHHLNDHDQDEQDDDNMVRNRHPFSKAWQYHIQTVFQPCMWFIEEPSQFSVGQTARSLSIHGPNDEV